MGRGTTIEYVESYAAADDGFEFFGGTVNAKYLVSSFNDDDSFDVDMGYRGTNQFWFAVQAPDKRNYGMELNNHPNELNQGSQLLPATDFKVYNLTIIGSGASSTNVNGGSTRRLRCGRGLGRRFITRSSPTSTRRASCRTRRTG